MPNSNRYRQNNREKLARKSRESYHRNKKKILERKLYYKFGLTYDSFEALKEHQDWKCAICRLCLSRTRRMCVDHDHQTGRVRGILCSGCNTGLGQFRDSVEMLELAIGYLKRTK